MSIRESIIKVLSNQSFIGAILIALIFIIIGFILVRKDKVQNGAKEIITILIMYIGLPAMAFKSFMADFDKDTFGTNLLVFALAIIFYIILLLLGNLVFIKKDKTKREAYSIFIAMGQVSYFSLPIIEAVYKTNEALIPINLVLVVFRFFLYLYSFSVLSGINLDKKHIKTSLKKILLNPILIAMFIGILIWVTQGISPKIGVGDIMAKDYSIFRIDKTVPALYAVITCASSLVIPLSMILIGFTLGKTNIKQALTNKLAWLISFIRVIICPILVMLITILIDKIKGIDFNEYQFAALVIGFGAPISAIINTYAIKYNREEEVASSSCLLSCMMSIISFPIMFILINLYFN